jgi:hypothetical protein
MYNPLTPHIVKIHQEHLLKEANKYRGLDFSLMTNRGYRKHLLARLGDFLILAGQKLHQRYEPAMHPNPKPY